MIGSVKLAPWSIIIVDTWMWTPYVMLDLPRRGCARSRTTSTKRPKWTGRRNGGSSGRSRCRWRCRSSCSRVLFRGIENFKMFDMVNLLTSGGPGSTTEVASITLKREAFEKWRTGYSSAFAIILFVSVFGLANIYVKALEPREEPLAHHGRHQPRSFGRRADPARQGGSRGCWSSSTRSSRWCRWPGFS